MPPKPAPPKKLTKKEQLELLKEEQRKKEEEEKKRQEEEEKKRQEDEQKRKELEEQMAAEERARLKKEKEELESFYVQVKGNSLLYEKKTKEKEDWEKYLQCNTKPDVTKEAEITTYLTQYKETNKLKNLSLKETVFDCQYTEDIVNDLTEIMVKALADEHFTKSKWCKSYINQLRQENYKKIDEATSYVIKNVDLFHQLEVSKSRPKDTGSKFTKAETHGNQQQKMLEINIAHTNKDIKYGIWINPNLKPVFRHKPIDFGETQIQVEVPKPMLTWQLVMRIVWYNYDPYQNETYTKDFVVGGVLDVSCFSFLPLPKEEIKSWTLKYDYETGDSLQKIQYPSADSTGPLSVQNAHPVRVFYTLPSNFFLMPNDPIRVAAYDPKNGWTTDNIEDIKYDFEKKLLTFSTLRLAPLAYIQVKWDRCTDFPYTSWKLRCVDEQKAILDIVGKRQHLKFEIGSGYVLLKDKNEPELSHVANKKLTPAALLHELYRCGINLMPVEQDAEAAGITKKNFEVEYKAIVDLCFAVRSFFIKSSKWNMAIPSERLLVRIRENLEFDLEFAEDQEKDWKSIVFWDNKCACIKAKDSAENLNDSLLEDTETHSNLEILLRVHDLTSPEALDRMKNLDYIGFVDTLKRFLKLTR